MNPIAVISFALGLLFVTNLISLADEDTRCQSLGPLVHFDPNARRPRDLITVYGDPRLGLTANPSDNCERIGNSGKWFVGMNDSGCAPTNVAMMEADKETGRLRLRELFRLIDAADFSKDGRFVFGGRSKNEGAAEVWECFSLADDRAVWAVEKDVVVLDAMFSPDGSQVIVLHGLGKVGLHMQSAVSWYDTATGRRLRRIQLPGEADPGAGAWSRYLLTMSQDTLFIAKPCQDSGDFFMVLISEKGNCSAITLNASLFVTKPQ